MAIPVIGERDARVARASRDLAWVDTRGRQERDTAVLEIVWSKWSETRSRDSWPPMEPPPLLCVEHLTCSVREDVGRSSESVEVLRQLFHQGTRQVHRPLSNGGLRWSFMELARDLDHVVGNADHPRHHFDIRPAQSRGLADSQRRPRQNGKRAG